jgi:C-terminal processing protease CtpA/Prc
LQEDEMSKHRRAAAATAAMLATAWVAWAGSALTLARSTARAGSAAAGAPAGPAAGPPAAAAATSAPAPPPPLANIDLSQGEPGKEPPGWFVPSMVKKTGYSAVVVAEHPEGGSRSALLQAPASGPPRGPAGFGNLMRSFDAAPYRGQRVRFRAAVKVQAESEGEGAGAGAGAGKAAGSPTSDRTPPPPPRAQLWLRVDRPGGGIGFFDNMDDRPITTAAWGRYEIVGDVPADAATINLGLMLIGGGRAWLSSASFETIAKTVSADEPARPLDARGLVNLVAFSRLVGWVRYFHPSDQAAAADWNRFVLAGVQRVEGAAGPEDLARVLTTLFLPLAPTVRVFPSDRPQPPAAELLAPPAAIAKPRVVAWRHLGLGIGTNGGGGAYKSERIDNLAPPLDPEEAPSQAPLPEPGKPLAADLGGGVSALVPLALYAGDHGTLPAVPAGVEPAAPAKPEGFAPSGNDRTTRLADVVLAWNVFEHFYPYFDVVGTDWPAELPRALRSAATDRDEAAFLDTLRRLVAALHDGHGGVTGKSDAGAASFHLPLLWDWVEDQLVVTQVDRQHAAGVEPGDVVIAIDGRPAAQALAAKEELISAATPQWRRFRALGSLLVGPAASVKLSVRHPSGATAAVTLTRSLPAYGPGALAERRPEKIAEVAPGIFYLDVNRVEDDDFKGALDRLSRGRGIIFDFRGYPRMSPIFLQHLSDKSLRSAHWNVPIVTRPDRRQMTFLSGGWTLEPLAPRLTAKLAFLTDGRAISYAETCLGIVEHYRLGEIVGAPTAGTNGNVNPFTLPGGYRIIWTGMQVLKHDGSRHHGVGILPTVPAAPTVKGIAEGRDEALERAIAVVSH